MIHFVILLVNNIYQGYKMKYSLGWVLGVVFFINMLSVNEAQAGIPIFWGKSEKIVKIHDLPKTENHKIQDGTHFDLGYKYEVFEIMWVPLHAYKESVVGYVSDQTYVPLTQAEVNYIVRDTNISDLGKIAKIPFWDAWGGKLIALALIALIIFRFMTNKKEQVAGNSVQGENGEYFEATPMIAENDSLGRFGVIALSESVDTIIPKEEMLASNEQTKQIPLDKWFFCLMALDEKGMPSEQIGLVSYTDFLKSLPNNQVITFNETHLLVKGLDRNTLLDTFNKVMG